MSRLAGHELYLEGSAYERDGSRAYSGAMGTGGSGRGKCSCGVLSEVLTSGNRRKQWHREHKDEIRANQEQK